MAITQNVRLYHEEGYAGQIASPLAISNRITAQNKTNAVISYGTPVVRDGARGCKPFGATDTEILGILIRDYSFDTAPGAEFGLPPTRTGTVLTLGEIYVVAGEEVQAGDPVYVGKGTDVLGQFVKSVGSETTAAVKVDGAVWRKDAAKGGLSVISLKIGG